MKGRRVPPSHDERIYPFVDTPAVTFSDAPVNDGEQILVGFLADGTPIIYCHDATLSRDVLTHGMLEAGCQILAVGGSLVTPPKKGAERWN